MWMKYELFFAHGQTTANFFGNFWTMECNFINISFSFFWQNGSFFFNFIFTFSAIQLPCQHMAMIYFYRKKKNNRNREETIFFWLYRKTFTYWELNEYRPLYLRYMYEGREWFKIVKGQQKIAEIINKSLYVYVYGVWIFLNMCKLWWWMVNENGMCHGLSSSTVSYPIAKTIFQQRITEWTSNDGELCPYEVRFIVSSIHNPHNRNH